MDRTQRLSEGHRRAEAALPRAVRHQQTSRTVYSKTLVDVVLPSNGCLNNGNSGNWGYGWDQVNMEEVWSSPSGVSCNNFFIVLFTSIMPSRWMPMNATM